MTEMLPCSQGSRSRAAEKACGICLLVAVAIPLGASLTCSLRPRLPSSLDRSGTVDLELRVQSGDILFRRQATFLSNTVLRFDREGTFSHVGLIVRVNDAVRVVHTVPFSGNGFLDGVRIDTMRAFLEGSETVDYALFRVHPEHREAALRAADQALRFYSRHIPFDTEFQLDSSDRLYCTELVWRAYLESGLALLTDLPNSLTALPLLRSKVLLPSTLQNSPYLRSIVTERLPE